MIACACSDSSPVTMMTGNEYPMRSVPDSSLHGHGGHTGGGGNHTPPSRQDAPPPPLQGSSARTNLTLNQGQEGNPQSPMFYMSTVCT